MSDRMWVARVGVGVALAATASTVALGLPWDVDMADSQAIRGYERAMNPLPEQIVSQPNMLTPTDWTHVTGTDMAYRTTPEGKAMTPFLMIDGQMQDFPSSDASLEMGDKMYTTYCWPCHGDGNVLGPVAAPGRYPAVPQLSGSAGRLSSRTDGEVYLTMLNGWGLMPSYEWAMNNEEMWAVVHYLRTLPQGEYKGVAQ